MRHKILIVDDDEALLRALPETLGLRVPDLDIDTCTHGQDALTRVRRAPYSAMLTDIRMPGIDGIKLISEAAALAPSMRVLVMTGHGDTRLVEQALHAGADSFMLKPIDRDTIAAEIRTVLNEHAALQDERQRLAAAGLTSDELAQLYIARRREQARLIMMAFRSGLVPPSQITDTIRTARARLKKPADISAAIRVLQAARDLKTGRRS